MQTTLIPTDFSLGSLHLVKQALENERDKRNDILLLYSHQLSDSISDLLFFSKSRTLRSLSNPEFEEACSILRNKYENSINSMRTDLFMGFTQQAFNRFLEANKVGKIYLPENNQVKIDRQLIKFANRSKTELLLVTLPEIQVPMNASLATQMFNF